MRASSIHKLIKEEEEEEEEGAVSSDLRPASFLPSPNELCDAIAVDVRRKSG